MPGGERRADGTASVAGGGLDPQSLVRDSRRILPLATQFNATLPLDRGSQPSLTMQGFNQTKDYFFRHLLDRAGQIHVPLRQQRLGLSRWTAEQLVEFPVGHS